MERLQRLRHQPKHVPALLWLHRKPEELPKWAVDGIEAVAESTVTEGGVVVIVATSDAGGAVYCRIGEGYYRATTQGMQPIATWPDGVAP